MRLARRVLTALIALAPLSAIPALASSPTAPSPEADKARAAVERMKQSSKGPFQRIRWYCADGSVLPPKAYACAERGGGIQHGELSDDARAVRAAGWQLANVLAGIDASAYVGPDADLDGLKQILLERFLVGWDDGWIFRGARTYRGALQAEDEEAGARSLVEALLADPLWREPARFLLLREAVRLLPLEEDAASAAQVRALALQIAEADAAFTPLRAKIHNQPDAGDAERVRAYMREKGLTGGDYEELAASIDALYAGPAAGERLSGLAAKVKSRSLASQLREGAETLRASPSPGEALRTSAALLVALRAAFPAEQDGATALAILQTSLALESDAFLAGNAWVAEAPPATRRQRVELLVETSRALQGAGFLSARQQTGVERSAARLLEGRQPDVKRYRQELRYLGRVLEWGSRQLAFHFERSVAHWAQIEPEAHLYPQDRVRASPLLFYGALVDGLGADANRLAGVEHELFGERVGAGLRALNPGLARGMLREWQPGMKRLDPEGIYMLPETVADLERIGGILTRGEGSSLSHVQLLARNLGIPNVVVGDALLPQVAQRKGRSVVLAASPGGRVQLAEDGARWEEVFGRESGEDVVIRPDLEKLDLTATGLLSLSNLRATDSGRTSGPKGANLGELHHHFGDAVPPGFVVPFGVFRKLLAQPMAPGGPSAFEWMSGEYDAIARITDPEDRRRRVARFLERLRSWIGQADPGPAFRAELREKLVKRFGPDGSWGVFVRSDTNVEDLPGFTGAGLNLTLPNVVGVDAVYEAIKEVWASPFTERAYGWRQSHMTDPEYVFPAVVLQQAFPSEKSGVMVTVDVDTGSRDVLTVAVNEGVGGAVEGQASESLSIPLDGGEVVLLAQATAPLRAVLSPAGGVVYEPASGTDAVLLPEEIDQLISLSRTVSRFPSLRDQEGRALPADVEFAFRDRKLTLLQIRPLVDSGKARHSAYLREMDSGFARRGRGKLDLDEEPAS